MSLPQFIVSPEALAGSRMILTGSELHHLRVRRLHVGSKVLLCDGSGQQRYGTVSSIDRRGAVIDLTTELPSPHESPLRLVLAQALLKSDKLDAVIEKTTELGVNELVLFSCGRSVSHVTSDRAARWNRVARSATKQCQRSSVPSITGPISFEELLAHRRATLSLLFWEDGHVDGITGAQRECPHADSVLAVVGPEGGFSAGEAERAAAAGFHLVGLAARILRADTAALVAATLCQFLWGDLARGDRGPADR